MARKSYSLEQKLEIINKAKEIGAVAAAKEAGASYATVLKWVKESTQDVVEKVKTLPANKVKEIDKQIATTEAEIKVITDQLKEKKVEFVGLKKARDKALKAQQAEKDLAEKKKVVDAVLKSGKSVEEILALLNT